MRTTYPSKWLKRIVIAVPVVLSLACLFGSRAYVTAVGPKYDYLVTEFPGQTITVQDVQINPPAMAVVEDVRMLEDGCSVVTLRAGEDARGAGSIMLADAGMNFELRVRDGVIIADGVNFSGWESVLVSLLLLSTVTGGLCIGAFLRLRRDAWFGYRMAAYAGFGLFFGVQAITFWQIALSRSARSFADLAESIVSIGTRFATIILVPVSVAALLVAASNVLLMRREGKGFSNMLGVLFSLAVVVACVVWRWVVVVAEDQLDWDAWVRWWFASSLVSGTISFGLALFAGVCVTAWLAARHVPTRPVDYVAILGCGLLPDGSPTPLLAGRVDAARALAARQAEAGHPAPTLVPSGGRGDDEPWSEAEAMARYLRAQGDPSRVVLEDRSANTRQNLAFCKEVIFRDAEQRGVDPQGLRIAFSTTNYHVLRGYVYAHAAGLAAEGVASPTKAYFWPNAFLREFVGMLAVRPIPVLVALLSAEALYAAALYATILGGA